MPSIAEFCAERARLLENLAEKTAALARETSELTGPMGRLAHPGYTIKLAQVDAAQAAVMAARAALRDHEQAHACIRR